MHFLTIPLKSILETKELKLHVKGLKVLETKRINSTNLQISMFLLYKDITLEIKNVQFRSSNRATVTWRRLLGRLKNSFRISLRAWRTRGVISQRGVSVWDKNHQLWKRWKKDVIRWSGSGAPLWTRNTWASSFTLPPHRSGLATCL